MDLVTAKTELQAAERAASEAEAELRAAVGDVAHALAEARARTARERVVAAVRAFQAAGGSLHSVAEGKA